MNMSEQAQTPVIIPALRVKATGRTGMVVRHDPTDAMLTYKLFFDDGAHPAADWFAEDQVMVPSREAELMDIELREAFACLDADNSGEIDAEELAEALAAFGFAASEEDVRGMILEADEDGNGAIDCEEFLKLTMPMAMDLAAALPRPCAVQQLELELHEVFSCLDSDGSGEIDAEELAEALAALGFAPSEEDVRDMILEVDENGNGAIDREEFLKLAMPMARAPAVAFPRPRKVEQLELELREAFACLDADGSGEIDAEELAEALAALGFAANEEAIRSMIQEADEDGNGAIDREEFLKLAMPMAMAPIAAF